MYLKNIDSGDKYFVECRALKLLQSSVQMTIKYKHMLIIDYLDALDQHLEQEFDATNHLTINIMQEFIRNFFKNSQFSMDYLNKTNQKQSKPDKSQQNLEKLYEDYKVFKDSILPCNEKYVTIDSAYNLLFFNESKGWFKQHKFQKQDPHKNTINDIKVFLKLVFSDNYLLTVKNINSIIHRFQVKVESKRVEKLFVAKFMNIILKLRKLISSVFSYINYLRYFQKKLNQRSHLVLNNDDDKLYKEFTTSEKPLSKKEKKLLKNQELRKSIDKQINSKPKKRENKTSKEGLKQREQIGKFQDVFLFLLLGDLEYSKTVIKVDIADKWARTKLNYSNSSLFNDEQILNNQIFQGHSQGDSGPGQRKGDPSSRDIKFNRLKLNPNDYFTEEAHFDDQSKFFTIYKDLMKSEGSAAKVLYNASFYDLSFFFEYIIKLMSLFLDKEFQYVNDPKDNFIFYNYLLIFQTIMEKEENLLLTKCRLFHNFETILRNCTSKEVYRELKKKIQDLYFRLPSFEMKHSKLKSTFPISEIFDFNPKSKMGSEDAESSSNLEIFLKEFYKPIRDANKKERDRADLNQILKECYLSEVDSEEFVCSNYTSSQGTTRMPLKNRLF